MHSISHSVVILLIPNTKWSVSLKNILIKSHSLEPGFWFVSPIFHCLYYMASWPWRQGRFTKYLPKNKHIFRSPPVPHVTLTFTSVHVIQSSHNNWGTVGRRWEERGGVIIGYATGLQKQSCDSFSLVSKQQYVCNRQPRLYQAFLVKPSTLLKPSQIKPKSFQSTRTHFLPAAFALHVCMRASTLCCFQRLVKPFRSASVDRCAEIKNSSAPLAA